VGHNGAGKSTLLKILYGLLKPDRGTVRIGGRTEAIIELGTAFRPLLSGRENIELGAAVHGLGSRDTRALIDKVVDFAGLDKFIDAPMQTYSSGMKARLSFALSAHLGPDLLLVDEVLAVGDTAFQRKCVRYMRRYLDDGGAIVFVSHNAYQIQSICNRGLVLDRGRALFQGSAVEALDLLMDTRKAEDSGPAGGVADVAGGVAIDELTVQAASPGPIRSGDPLDIVLRYTASEPLDIRWGFSFWTQDQWVCIAGEQREDQQRIGPGSGTLRCRVERLPLVGGRYVVRAAILDGETNQPLALRGFYDKPATLTVEEEPSSGSNIKMALNQLIHMGVAWR
jgi:ABC-type polysaccharide/polyol phosphate transport system ATPase subunit